jgi:hypothetical protein
MSCLIRHVLITPQPRPTSEDAPVIRYPNTAGLLTSQVESQQRSTERSIARMIRAGRQPAVADSVQPIRLPSNNNFFINLPIA